MSAIKPHKIKILLYLFTGLLLSCSQSTSNLQTTEVVLTETDTTSTAIAGDPIQLHFKVEASKQVYLLISNSYTKTILKPIAEKENYQFRIPKTISNKAGFCQWQLIATDKTIAQGKIKIEPLNLSSKHLETYLGPRDIIVGGRDYSMLVVIPTDSLDNPLSNYSKVTINVLNRGKRNSAQLNTQDFIAFQNTYSSNMAGPIYFAASTNGGVSNEMTSIMKPSIPEDFSIEVMLKHAYADGNQTLEIETSVIKDEFGNTIIDGTLVNFSIETSRGQFILAQATTIKGRAKALILHPSQAQTWVAQAYINGLAESNIQSINFKQATTSFDTSYDATKRIIKIESALSYMGQKVPDGSLIRYWLYNKDGKEMLSGDTNTKDGIGAIDLSKQFLPNESYTVTIELMGISKTLNIELYDNINE